MLFHFYLKLISYLICVCAHILVTHICVLYSSYFFLNCVKWLAKFKKYQQPTNLFIKWLYLIFTLLAPVSTTTITWTLSIINFVKYKVKLLNIISFPYNLNFPFLWVKVLNKRDGHVWKVKSYKYEKWICSSDCKAHYSKR